MLLVISFQRLEAVRDYSLDNSFERFETVRNYFLPNKTVAKFRSGFERFRTIWNYLEKMWGSNRFGVMNSFERFETVWNYLLENSFERCETVSNQSLGAVFWNISLISFPFSLHLHIMDV